MDTAKDMEERFLLLGTEAWEDWEAILRALGPQLMALLRTGNEDVFYIVIIHCREERCIGKYAP